MHTLTIDKARRVKKIATQTKASAPNQIGYVVVIGNPAVDQPDLFIGWAVAGGIGELLTRVQFGSPENLAVLDFALASPARVASFKKSLAKSEYRKGSGWFSYSDDVHAVRMICREAA